MMRLQVFDVQHGACALFTSDNNARLLIDCGHNSDTGWRPGTYLKGEGISQIEMLAVTNYDEDHVSGADNLFGTINVRSLLRNKSVTGVTLKQLKSEDGMGRGIARLAREIDNTYTGGSISDTPQAPLFGSMQREVFYNSYPKFDDENNLSMALFLRTATANIMFTGDLEKAGFAELLKNEAFRAALRATNVYIASHHGRENGCSDEVAALLTNVYFVVISDQGYQFETQKTLPFYHRIAKGGPFRNETRHVLTTRRDGRIGFDFSDTSWNAF